MRSEEDRMIHTKPPLMQLQATAKLEDAENSISTVRVFTMRISCVLFVFVKLIGNAVLIVEGV